MENQNSPNFDENWQGEFVRVLCYFGIINIAIVQEEGFRSLIKVDSEE